MAEAAHSKWSPSAFEAAMLCPGKPVLEQGLPDSSSAYAREGTAAHQLLTWALQQDVPAAAFIGRYITVEDDVFEVDEEMAGHVQVTIDFAKQLAGNDGEVFSEIVVNFARYLDVPEDEAWGTSDIIILKGAVLHVIDLKYGRGVVVEAEGNPQMSLYALGSLAAYQGLLGDIERVHMHISQPRLSRTPSSYEISVADLETWARSTARSAVATAQNALQDHLDDRHGPVQWREVYLRPGESQCQFCKAKASCPKLREEVTLSTSGAVTVPMAVSEFSAAQPVVVDTATSPEFLSVALSKVDMIEDWCKAVRAAAERRLLAGEKIPGYKVVQGKKGNRKWIDEEDAKTVLKSIRLKSEEMYDYKLISPTSAEKLLKAGTISERQWKRVAACITQSEGKMHVAPDADSRPAIDVRPVVEEFPTLPDTSDLV